MTLEQLRAFVCVAQTLNFGKAAEQLFLSQPAVSKRITRLEESLSTRLFDRIGTQVQLTPDGAYLLTEAVAILAQIANIQRDMQNRKNEVSGELTIATSHHIGLHRLPPILKKFAELYPNVQLNLNFMDSEQAFQQITQADLDLAIMTIPHTHALTLSLTRSLTHAPVTTHAVWHDELVFVCHKSHPLAHTPCTLTSLLEHSALLPNKQTATRHIIDNFFNSHGLTTRNHGSTHTLETIKMMTTIKLGWSVLPKHMLDDSLTLITLTDYPQHTTHSPLLIRRLGYAINPQRTLPNAAEKFITLLKHL